MEILKEIKERIAKGKMPEKSEGHLEEVLNSVKNQTENIEAFGCFPQDGCLYCCVEIDKEEYCWIEWCHA
jgi:hypothetical protein